MNNMIKTACAVAVLATSANVMAESIDVRVIGTISPTACTPTLSGGGTIDYGTIKPESLSKDDYTTLAEKTIDFAIQCDAPAKIAVKAINNRPDTVAGTSNDGVGGSSTTPTTVFGSKTISVAGLGMAGDKRIGGYGVRIAGGTVQADGKAVDGIYHDSTGKWAGVGTGANSGALYVYYSTRYQSWAEAGKVEPLAFTQLSGKLAVQAFINKQSELDLTKPITLDGSTTIELVYL